MQPLIEALRRNAKHFGPSLARTARERGLAVTNSQGDVRPIPITATPIIIEAAELRRRADLAARLSSAAFKMARSILSGSAKEVIASALSPLERRIAEKTFASVSCLATTRVDYFVANDRPMALEINATIPAMQGYSDIAAQSFIEVVGRHLEMSDSHIAALTAKNGSNALALYRALLDGFALQRRGMPARIALLCRRNDSQLSEIQYLCARFNEWGTDAEVVFPDELSGDKELTAHGKTFDFMYRHLFVRRLEEIDAPYVRELLSEIPNPRAVILNPPASQVEVKTTFALLSEAGAESDVARAANLSETEVLAIREAVPWTRPFRRTSTQDPDGKRVTDLVSRVSEDPDRFVLKRSWDYGGKAVFVGAAVGETSFDERVRAAYGSSLRWSDLCARAAEDTVGGGFVVQEIVRAQPEPHLLCDGAELKPVDLYVDFSAYASVGLKKQPAWGGVCRGSLSRIVNILGGGGVLPLITTEVAQSLMTAFTARGL